MLQKGIKPSEHTFSSIISGLTSHSNQEHTKIFLQHWNSIAQQYDIRLSSFSQVKMLDLMSKAGDAEKASEWVKKVGSDEETNSVGFSVLIAHHSRERQFQSALEVFQKALELNKISTVVYITFIDACGFTNQPAFLDVIYQDLSRKYLPNYSVLSSVKSLELENAATLIRNKDIPLCLNMINSLIEAYARCNLFEKSVNLFYFLKGLAFQFQHHDSSMYHELQPTPKTVVTLIGGLRAIQHTFPPDIATEFQNLRTQFFPILKKNIDFITDSQRKEVYNLLHKLQNFLKANHMSHVSAIAPGNQNADTLPTPDTESSTQEAEPYSEDSLDPVLSYDTTPPAQFWPAEELEPTDQQQQDNDSVELPVHSNS